MKPTQKVTNTASQLPAYFDKGTNILGKVTNASFNTIYVIVGINEILKPTNKSVQLKMKSTQKVTNTATQLPTYYHKGTNILGRVPNISCNTRITLNFKSMLLQEL